MLALLQVMALNYWVFMPLVGLLLLGLLAACGWYTRRDRRRAALLKQVLVAFTLEELVTAPLWWSVLGGMVPITLGLWGAGAAVLLLAWRAERPWDGALPLKGIWLRRAVAGTALIALVAAGPWLFSLSTLWVLGESGTLGLPPSPVYYRGGAAVLAAALFLCGGLVAWTVPSSRPQPCPG